MFNSFENHLNNSVQKPDKEVDQLAETFKNLSKDLNGDKAPQKNTFTPEGWFIHEAKGTETMEEIKALPEFKESTEEEMKALFEKYSDKFKSEPASSDKSI